MFLPRHLKIPIFDLGKVCGCSLPPTSPSSDLWFKAPSQRFEGYVPGGYLVWVVVTRSGLCRADEDTLNRCEFLELYFSDLWMSSLHASNASQIFSICLSKCSPLHLTIRFCRYTTGFPASLSTLKHNQGLPSNPPLTCGTPSSRYPESTSVAREMALYLLLGVKTQS